MAQHVQATISNSAVNIAGSLPQNAVQQLYYGGYGFVRQEGWSGFTGSYTIAVSQDLPWKGVEAILRNQGIELRITAAA